MHLFIESQTRINRGCLGVDCCEVNAEQNESDLSGVGQQTDLTIAFSLSSLMSVLYFQEASVYEFHTSSAVVLYSLRNVCASTSSVFMP